MVGHAGQIIMLVDVPGMIPFLKSSAVALMVAGEMLLSFFLKLIELFVSSPFMV